MSVQAIAKLDVKGSECLPNLHYVFGKQEDAIKGGFYIDKSQDIPDEIIIKFIKEEKENGTGN